MSSLDTHVAAHIVRHCIFGLLANRTRIIVTENAEVIYRANQVVRIENGCMRSSKLGHGSLDSVGGGAEAYATVDDDAAMLSSIELNADAGDQSSLDSVMMEVCVCVGVARKN